MEEEGDDEVFIADTINDNTSSPPGDAAETPPAGPKLSWLQYKHLLHQKKETHIQELTTWANDVLRHYGDHRPITDLLKRVSDGITLVQLLEILGGEKIPGVHRVPSTAEQRTENLRHCVNHVTSGGGDTPAVSHTELADGNLKSTLMFMNNIRKRYDSQLAPREMADGACQPGQTSSRPGSAHARYPPPDPRDHHPHHQGTHPSSTYHQRPHSGPYGTRPVSADNIVLPGTLGKQEEDSRTHAPPPSLIKRPPSQAGSLVMGMWPYRSTTELDRNSASQRGVDERRGYLPTSAAAQSYPPPRPRSAKPSSSSAATPPPPPSQAQQAWTTSASSSGSTPKVPPKQFGSSQEVREAVSLTVEERLRSLLASPGQTQPQPMKLHHAPPPPHNPPPPPGGYPVNHKGQVNGGYSYDDGELLLPPPRPPQAEHAPRHGPLENGVDRGAGHHHGHQGSIGSEAELHNPAYVPSRPSERMSGVSRGQALHAPRPPQPGGSATSGPPLPPKSVGQPPRYQPPPQYSPFQRRPGDTPTVGAGHGAQNGPSGPGASSDLRNMCNKLYTRDSQPPYNGSQQGPPSPYGHQQQQQQSQQQQQLQQQQQQQQYGRYGNHSGQQQAPRTSPMGQSSSATSSHASGQGSSNHSPSSPNLRRPAPHPAPPSGYGPDRRHPSGAVDGRLSASGLPYNGESSAVEKRLSSASAEHKSGYDRPEMPLPQLPPGSSHGQGHRPDSRTSRPGPPDMAGRPASGADHSAAARQAASRLQPPSSAAGPSGVRGRPVMTSSSGGPRGDSLELGDLGGGRIPGPHSASAAAHQASQMALKSTSKSSASAKWRDSLASEEGGNYSPSIASSRSVTPPLPPLSPDNTPPHTPPDSPSRTRREQLPPGFLHRKPDVVTSTSKKSAPVVVNGKKKTARRAGPAGPGLKSWDGRQKRHPAGKSHRRGPSSKPPRPPSGVSGTLSPDLDSADEETATNTSFTEADYATVHGAAGSGALEVHEARIIRQQLEGLETMYHEILKLLGLDREYIPGSRRSISSTSSISRSGRPRMKRNHSGHNRSRDLKQVNKRFARLESHVVTLARSVAHLSSEMRTHNGLYTDVEEIKRELVRLKDLASNRAAPQVFLNEWERFRGWVPSLTNPKRVNKLTKFFGQEPPLLHLFLKKLGYEKYTTNFEQEKIGMIELPYMNEDRLQRIGIPMGPRLRILQEAQLCFRQENFDIYIV